MLPELSLRELSNGLENKTEYNEKLLQEYKIRDNSGFPPSYIEFVKTLGWGRLCNLFLIYVPFKKQHPDSWDIRSSYIRALMDDFYNNKDNASYSFLLEPDGTLDLAKNAVPFGMSENGEYLLWDAQNPDERGEYPIYVLASRMGGIRYGGKDLIHFINLCVNDRVIKRVMGLGYSKLPPRFEPLA